MKRNIAKMLVLLLMLGTLLPQTALAATTYYVDVTITGPDADGVERTLSAGHAAIAADDRTDVRAAFTVAVTGLRQLAEAYPGHVAEDTGRTPAQEEPNGSAAAGCCPGAVPGSGQQRKKET